MVTWRQRVEQSGAKVEDRGADGGRRLLPTGSYSYSLLATKTPQTSPARRDPTATVGERTAPTVSQCGAVVRAFNVCMQPAQYIHTPRPRGKLLTDSSGASGEAEETGAILCGPGDHRG